MAGPTPHGRLYNARLSQRAIAVWSASGGRSASAASQVATTASPAADGTPVACSMPRASLMSLTMRRIENPASYFSVST